MDYIAPTRSIAFTLDSVADLGDQSDGAETVSSILNEVGAFASEVLGPLNREGDLVGARFADGQVCLPEGWRQAYAAW